MAEVVRTEPAEFIQAAAKVYLDDLTKGIGSIKSDQLDLADFMGRKFIAELTANILSHQSLVSALEQTTIKQNIQVLLRGFWRPKRVEAYRWTSSMS